MTVAKHETGSTLTIHDGQEFWTAHQIAALTQLGVKDAPNGDLAVFFHQCQRTGLDPFARQVYMIGRYDGQSRSTKYTIQTGIDGFRLVGRRAADAAHHTIAISATEWCGPDGVWQDVWLSAEPPAAARITIYRDGGAFPAIALWTEYAQTTKDGGLTRMWRERSAGQLAKCAEALAWRKAFPQDLSGLYTSDEMARANGDQPTAPTAVSQAQTLDAALDGIEAFDADEPVDAEVVVEPLTAPVSPAEPTAEQVAQCTDLDTLRAMYEATSDRDLRARMRARKAELEATDGALVPDDGPMIPGAES